MKIQQYKNDVIRKNIMKKTNEKPYHYWWALGVFALGFFFLTLFEPPPDYVIFQCDRTNKICTLEKRALFRIKTKIIKIEDIRYAHFEKLGFFIRGYHGPEIKLQDGNDISIGAGSTGPFTSKEQKTVEEINKFLSSPELKQLFITQRGIPAIIVAGIFLFVGIFSIYKVIRPYIIQGSATIRRRIFCVMLIM